MTWTEKSVKELLPAVTVKVGRNIVPGRVSGRLNAFATVSVKNQGTLHNRSYIYGDWQVAWCTIVYCLNEGKPIKV